MDGRTEEYLERAKRLRAEATDAFSERYRRQLLDIAFHWEERARQAAAGEDQDRRRRPPEERSFGC